MSMSFALRPRSGGLGADATGHWEPVQSSLPRGPPPPPGGTRQASHSKRASAGGWAAAGGGGGPRARCPAPPCVQTGLRRRGGKLHAGVWSRRDVGERPGQGPAGTRMWGKGRGTDRWSRPREDVGGREHQEWRLEWQGSRWSREAERVEKTLVTGQRAMVPRRCFPQPANKHRACPGCHRNRVPGLG